MSDNRPYRDDPNAEESGIGEEGNPIVQRLAANSYFPRLLKCLAWVVSLTSLLTMGLLITVVVFLNEWVFDYVAIQKRVNTDLAIVLGVTAFVTIPTLFAVVPILIKIIVHLIMAIQVISYSAHIFAWQWPTERICIAYEGTYPDRRWVGPSAECREHVRVLQIMDGVAGGVGILIGVLTAIMLFARVIALIQTRFWQDNKMLGWLSLKGFQNFSGFTLQLSFSVIPAGSLPVMLTTQSHNSSAVAGSSDQERLIET